jgi:hypothetical protein
MEASRHVDRGSIGQRHHGANARDRHQAPAHLIIPHDGQQAAVLDDDETCTSYLRNSLVASIGYGIFDECRRDLELSHQRV